MISSIESIEAKCCKEYQMVKIKDVLDISKGMRLAGDAKEEGLFPLFTCKATIPTSNFSDYEGEHILIGSGGYFRIYRSKGKFSASSDMFVCKAKGEVSIVFLYHILRTKMEYFNSKGKGSTIKHLSKRLLEEELIPLPPYVVQLEIEKKLLAVESVVNKIESNLEEFGLVRKEILNRAFRGELTEQDIADGTGQELLASIQLEREQQEAGTKRKKKTELAPVEAGEEPYDLPENWMWTRLGEALEIKHGYAFKGSDFSESKTNRILVTPGNISTTGDYSTNKNRYYIEDGSIPVDYILVENDLIMNLTDLTKECKTLGRTVFIPNDKEMTYLHNQRLGKILTQSNLLLSKYIHYFSMGGLFRNHIVATATGTTVRHTSPDKIYKSSFPLPPLAEQHRIVEKIEAIFATLDTMEQAILLQKAEASTCYEEILRKSLEGK